VRVKDCSLRLNPLTRQLTASSVSRVPRCRKGEMCRFSTDEVVESSPVRVVEQLLQSLAERGGKRAARSRHEATDQVSK